MNKNGSSLNTPDALGELVQELLECGGVLSQMISGMVEFEASGRGAPDTAPIPEIAHGLIRQVSDDVRHDFSKRDLKTAARIVHRVTEAICNDIYAVSPEMMDELLADDADDDRPPG
jgi:hypothetical protein